MKKFSLFLTVLGACLLFAPPEVKAAPDPVSYRLIVQYFDGIQIKYTVRHGLDEWWTTTGDIPIGVAKIGVGDSATGQIYCIDATVPFHSYSGVITTRPGGVTTDSVKNYVVATPFQYSDALRANLKEIQWLTVNGYTGHNLLAIQTAYGHLGAIDDTIALMATKIAIWHYTNERDFSVLTTSLHNTPREALMFELMEALIRDAKTQPLLGPITLNVSLSAGSPPSFYLPAPVDGYYYYGPFQASEIVSSGSSLSLNDIFLSVGGVASEGVKFVQGNVSNPYPYSPLSEADMYGTSQKQPYVANGDYFWLKIPESRADVLGSPSAAADGLVLHALGKADVIYNDSTPLVLVYQNPTSGAQNWNEVQAFIGISQNATGSLYGEGSYVVNSANPLFLNGDIRIGKRVTNGTDADNDARYTFRLTMFSGGKMIPVQLIPNQNITGQHGLSAVSEDGVFTLSDGGEAQIKHLPMGIYTFAETPDLSHYDASFRLGSNSDHPGTSTNIYLVPGITSNTVTVTNNILRTPPSNPVPPSPPLTIVNKPFVPTGGTGTPSDPFEGQLILPCCPCPESLRARRDILANEPADVSFFVDYTYTCETWADFDLYTDEVGVLYFTVNFVDGTHYYYKAWLSKENLIPPTIVRKVTLPGVEGLTSVPPPSAYVIESGTDFTFTLTPDEPLPEGTELSVTTNRTNVPRNEDVEVTANSDGSYTYLIRSIRQALNISIELVPPTITGSGSVAGEKVWTDNRTLYIYAAQDDVARVYSITGRLAATVPCTGGGTAQTNLPAGIYAVKTAKAVYKVVVK